MCVGGGGDVRFVERGIGEEAGGGVVKVCVQPQIGMENETRNALLITFKRKFVVALCAVEGTKPLWFLVV